MTVKTVMIRGKARKVRVMPNGMYRFLKGGGGGGGGGKKRRVRSVARKKSGRTGRARRWIKRQTRGMGVPSIAGIGLMFYTMDKFGFFAAAQQARNGDLVGAASTLAYRASNVNTYIGPVCGGLALKGIRSVSGPMVLGRVGRHAIRLW